MKKLLPIAIIIFLMLNGLGAVALNSDLKKLDFLTIDFENTGDGNRDYTHTILVEVGTGSWCYWCQFTNAVMHDIYTNGNYDFEYFELVDSNPIAGQRINEFNQHSYPTSFFDGGYQVHVGGTNTWPAYTSKMDISGARAVPDIYSTMDVFWLGGEQIDIDVSIQNNEASEYTGHLHVYVVEIVSRWKDYANADYHHGFLDYAFNQDISIPAGEAFTANTVWDGSSWNNPDITLDNIQVILAVYNSEWHQGYADPPSGDPFDAYYVDDCIGEVIGDGPSDPPETPDAPIGPSEGTAGIEYTFSAGTTDPNGDNILYQFDWGDGSVSGWYGPASSGQPVDGSYTWSTSGSYDIRVRAKDDNSSSTTDWSAPHTITILDGPVLDIQRIQSGLLKVTTAIKNIGEAEATDINWNIVITGGILLLDGSNSGTIESIIADTEQEISSKTIIGFGKIRVLVTCEMADGPSDQRDQGATVLLFFIKVNPGGGI